MGRRELAKKAGTAALAGAAYSAGGLIRAASAHTTEPPDVRWVRGYGGTEGERNRDLIRTRDGGFALVGYTRSINSDTPTRSWLVKVDSDGDGEWSRDCAWGTFNSVTQVDDGYVVGGDKSGPDGGMWVLRTDPDGEIEWSCTFGSGGWVFTARQLADGGIVGGGSALVKVDRDGNKQWCREGPVQDVCATEDGGFVSVSGPSLTKWRPDGEIQWRESFGGHARDDFYSVTRTESGGFALAGIVKSTPDAPPETRVVRTDAAGDVSWDVSVTPAGLTGDIVETSAGDLLVAGTTGDFRVAKLAPDGERRWSARTSGATA